jgi:hypothetical protein
MAARSTSLPVIATLLPSAFIFVTAFTTWMDRGTSLAHGLGTGATVLAVGFGRGPVADRL